MPTPWYRQFWPWFLIALPTASVLGCLATLVIAVRGADSLVRDDWYKHGLAINRELGRDREAGRRQLEADLQLDTATGNVSLALRGHDVTDTAVLLLELAHPTQAERDIALPLTGNGDGRFSARFPSGLQGRWHVTLAPPTGEWRLTSRLDLPRTAPLQLRPQP